MPARARAIFTPCLLQEVLGLHHVVDILDLVVDVLHAGCGDGKQRDRMMHGADAQERRIAEPIGDARVAQLGPEFRRRASRRWYRGRYG